MPDPVDAFAQSLMREPTASEMEYFRKNPQVGGMATEDNAVIINPESNLTADERRAVAINEASRVLMRADGAPTFDLTDQQRAFLDGNTYAKASDSDRKATIAARILSGDPSAGAATPEQQEYVKALRSRMARPPQPQPGTKGLMN